MLIIYMWIFNKKYIYQYSFIFPINSNKKEFFFNRYEKKKIYIYKINIR